MSRVLVLSESQIKYDVYDSEEEALANHDDSYGEGFIIIPVDTALAKRVTTETKKVVTPYESR